MHIDLITLYALAIGTLLVSAGMTLWERTARPEHRRPLGILAAAYACLALGCFLATDRQLLPGVYGRPVSNLVILTGYLLILDGIGSLGTRRHRPASAILLVAMAALWIAGGERWQDAIWSYASAFPIALACGLAAVEVARNPRLRELRSRPVVVAVSGCHALLYAGRTLLLPVLAEAYGPPAVRIAAAITMYGGVLYSVVLPMALLAMIREEAHDRLLRRSQTDYLTGLGNREWFFEQGARLVDRCPPPLSLLAFDLDHFKAINDRHGHAIGDEVLKSFARDARAIVGPDAILARIGGEEFAALLPGRDGDQAGRVAQAVAQCFADAVTLTDRGFGVRTTVSVGVVERTAHCATLEQLLSEADRALYVAKAEGRNRIEMAPRGTRIPASPAAPPGPRFRAAG